MECKLPKSCYCKPCRKIYDAKYYQNIKHKRKKYVKKRVKELRQWLNSLKNAPCVDCKNKFHHVAMQYDHINNDKTDSISNMVKDGQSKESILKEIAKCELVCANCHAIRTYSRLKHD